jgi:hypothetical protein
MMFGMASLYDSRGSQIATDQPSLEGVEKFHVLRWLIGLATSLMGNHIYLVTLAWVAVQRLRQRRSV